LFEFTKKDVAFVWTQDCQRAFDALKKALMGAPILVRPNFKEPFCLDVDWSTKGVGAILSQKEGRFESHSLRQQGIDRGTKEVSPHGRGMLCFDLGNPAL
jgi:hypothetical protein